jgi:hypothetical protein
MRCGPVLTLWVVGSGCRRPGDGSSVLLGPRREPLLIFGGRESEGSLEVAVEVTLVGEARGGGGLGDRRAGLEHAAGSDAMSDLQRVWGGVRCARGRGE